LVSELRDNLAQAKAAENLVLAQDLRRALANVSAELKVRKPVRSFEVIKRRPATPLLRERTI
jgi:hypothetical protein